MDTHPDPRSVFKDTGFDRRTVTITEGDPDKGGYVAGHLKAAPQIEFSAHLTDMGSGRGIEGGRIIKLIVSTPARWRLVYDQGWIRSSTREADLRILRQLLRAFPERILRDPLPSNRSDFARSSRRPAGPEFAKSARRPERAANYRFRENARSVGRAR